MCIRDSASFETITFLAGKLDELNLPAVLTIENSDQKVAKAVIENTNTKDQKILTLNSMQSVTTKDVEEGTTYLSIMENNLQILKEACLLYTSFHNHLCEVPPQQSGRAALRLL